MRTCIWLIPLQELNIEIVGYRKTLHHTKAFCLEDENRGHGFHDFLRVVR